MRWTKEPSPVFCFAMVVVLAVDAFSLMFAVCMIFFYTHHLSVLAVIRDIVALCLVIVDVTVVLLFCYVMFLSRVGFECLGAC